MLVPTVPVSHSHWSGFSLIRKCPLLVAFFYEFFLFLVNFLLGILVAVDRDNHQDAIELICQLDLKPDPDFRIDDNVVHWHLMAEDLWLTRFVEAFDVYQDEVFEALLLSLPEL